jgi:hypothetical protein
MRTITLAIIAIIAVFAACTSEKIYHTQTSNPLFDTQTSDATHLAVLVGRSARIEGSELIWSCVYQTAEGRVVSQQREECASSH